MDRQGIIDAIKRTAAANGGRPLGRLRLENETGIRSYDWMKHWARFQDAQREAGFEPNLKTTAYDEEHLIKALVSLARELGHFPAQSDLRVKGHAHKSFPSLRTFDTRLGVKSQVLAKVAAYCAAKPEYADVLQWCATEPEKTPTGKADTSGDGYVYLIKSGRFHKIGRTNALGRREYELAIQLPEQAKTVHHIKTDDPEGIEAYWHRRFEVKRKNGEWFELSVADVSAFRRRKFM